MFSNVKRYVKACLSFQHNQLLEKSETASFVSNTLALELRQHRTLTQLPRVIVTFHLLNTLTALEPTHAVFAERLDPRLELRFVQLEVIHRSNSRDGHAWIPARHSVHQRTAHRAEVVAHRVASRDCLVLRELRELVLASDMLERGVLDYEVRSEH